MTGCPVRFGALSDAGGRVPRRLAGSGNSVKELTAIMIRLSGLSIKPTYEKAREGDIEKSQADISLAKNLINWVPKTTLEEGLKKIFPKIES